MSRAAPVREAVLAALKERGPMTTPEIARTIRNDTNSVSSALNRLLNDGLVQVKRTKPGAAAAGMHRRPPNLWRLKPGLDSQLLTRTKSEHSFEPSWPGPNGEIIAP